MIQHEFIPDEDLDQALSFDFWKNRADELESELSLARLELKWAKEHEAFWKDAYDELNKTFIEHLRRR